MFYVYAFFRPCGTPCYIGKGQRDRYRVHFRKSSNSHLARIIAKYGELPVIIVRTGLTEPEALEIEIALIAAIGRECDGGPLVNLTLGGEGTSGVKHPPRSERWRLKMSAAKTGQKQSAETISRRVAANTGKVRSDETRAKMSMSNRRTITKEQREKIAASLTGKKQTAEANAKRSAAMRGRVRTPEHRAALSASLMGRVPSEACREAARVANSARHQMR
jgi:hypothetical protein